MELKVFKVIGFRVELSKFDLYKKLFRYLIYTFILGIHSIFRSYRVRLVSVFLEYTTLYFWRKIISVVFFRSLRLQL